MRITILTIGSRGDVQPYVGLGVGTPPVPQKRITVERIRAEDGVGTAVRLIARVGCLRRRTLIPYTVGPM
ncbi:MAG: hypothetical protein OEO20_11130 [Gemmatimonadota bacterium]|nr:hypothetical protein [Gemmatimonadota bacterium]MDH3367748.1 hypothetical protein [Gemmatimonadota bacterium]MDH3478846.1 hypothetical protein [Gemmatimonadota bacterium]MDH3569473.1 hypothetical protein [Gemmatimonadota bacterium]MDH5549711.1 hypothetical protein [Gemmatimonadota bacterium]